MLRLKAEHPVEQQSSVQVWPMIGQPGQGARSGATEDRHDVVSDKRRSWQGSRLTPDGGEADSCRT